MIKLKNVNLSFGNKTVLDNLNLQINKRDKFLLNQKSGSGKTTLIKSLMGFVQPDSGDITINGEFVNKDNIDSIRNNIFYLDQDITLPELVVSELLDEILEYRGNKNKNIRFNLEDLLDEFQLNTRILEKNVKQLSGGERQRIGLIIGIILDRPIWLLDEPTSALDKNLKEIVTKRVINSDKTTIIISHDSCWSEIPIMNWSKEND